MHRRTAAGVLLALAVAAPATAATTEPPRPDPVDLGGTPVEGGFVQAPTPLTAGLWSDTLTGPGQSPANTRWFSYQRVMADSTVLVGAVATSAEDSGDQLQVAVTTPDGETCGPPDSSTQGSEASGSAFGAIVVAGPGDDGGSTTCSSAPELYVAVSRGSTSEVTTPLPYTLRLVEEAPVTSDRGPEPLDEVRVDVPSPQEPRRLPGGDSFDDAPTVEGTVGDVVPQGVERLWRVHLDWGQSLAVLVTLPVRPDDDAAPVDPVVDVTLFDPLRNSFDGGAVDRDTTGSYGSEPTRLFDGTPPVAYLNRTDSDDVAFVPGDYWISVAVSPGDEQTVDVPVDLTVAVADEVDEAPRFPEDPTGPDGRPGPGGYDLATPYLVGEGVFAVDVSGSPTAPQDESAGSGTAADDDVRRRVGLGVGAGSLVSLLAGLVLLRRRSRVSRAATS